MWGVTGTDLFPCSNDDDSGGSGGGGRPTEDGDGERGAVGARQVSPAPPICPSRELRTPPPT